MTRAPPSQPMLTDPPDTPPAYHVRRSARARNVRVSVTPQDGVVVVVPDGFDERRLPALVAEHRVWIERQLERFGDSAAFAAQRDSLPDRIVLTASGATWQVDYMPAGSLRVRVRETAGRRLAVRGRPADRAAARAALKRWLSRSARAHLVARLDELSTRHGLPYRRATIRYQRTRWGSCSSSGTISLNARLMFLHPEQVRCVLVHELCHTRHLNHGKRFRALLRALEPGYMAIDRALRDGWRHVPAWTYD